MITAATKHWMECQATTVFIAVAVLVLVLSCGGVACAEIYADSAHGNTSYGVNRSTATCENWPGGVCSKGSCAHCHDTFDPTICGDEVNHPKMLFEANNSPASQTDNFCFQCHKGGGSVQVGGITNETYSANFGGGTSTFTTIYDAFNPATGVTPSSHNLADVLNHAVGRDIGFTSDTNPCLVCHDHHASQKNFPVLPSGLGGVKTAVRRPADYASPPTNLWGDESGSSELMSEYTDEYQAPYYVGGTNYEPANDGTADGSNLPNFFNFCTNQCHANSNVYSTERGRYLRRIIWSDGENNDEHGKTNNYRNTGVGTTKGPFSDQAGNYVLACTDCHEPHGSENEWLLRTTVNGTNGLSVTGDGEWSQICAACHTWNLHAVGVTTCWGDGVWNCHHHGSGGGMF